MKTESSPVIIQGASSYRLTAYQSEKELEDTATRHIGTIFGSQAAYVDLKRKLTSKNGISGIPDGFVIDFQRRKLFIVEVELSKHDIIRHISNQLLRFKVAMNNLAGSTLASDLYLALKEQGSPSADLKLIQKMLTAGFGIAIIIDSVSEQLIEIVGVLSRDGTEVLTVPFETYRDAQGNVLYKFNTFTKEALADEAKKWSFTWSTVPVEHHLDKRGQSLATVFNELDKQLLTFPGVVQKSRKNWVTYQTSPLKNFCTVKFLPDALEVHLKCDESFDDPREATTRIARTPAWTFDRVLRIQKVEDVNYATDLLRQAYGCVCEVGKHQTL